VRWQRASVLGQKPTCGEKAAVHPPPCLGPWSPSPSPPDKRRNPPPDDSSSRFVSTSVLNPPIGSHPRPGLPHADTSQWRSRRAGTHRTPLTI